jgi:hypothetical protein
MGPESFKLVRISWIRYRMRHSVNHIQILLGYEGVNRAGFGFEQVRTLWLIRRNTIANRSLSSYS